MSNLSVDQRLAALERGQNARSWLPPSRVPAADSWAGKMGAEQERRRQERLAAQRAALERAERDRLAAVEAERERQERNAPALADLDKKIAELRDRRAKAVAPFDAALASLVAERKGLE